MKLWVFAIMATTLIALQSASAGPKCPERPKDEKEAKKLAGEWWRTAQKSFAAERYEDALREWRCSDSLAPHPLVMYNLGRAAEGAKKYALALKYYEGFLKALPDAPNRREVELSIKVLKNELERLSKPEYKPEQEPEFEHVFDPEVEPESSPWDEPDPAPIVYTEPDAPIDHDYPEPDLKKTHRPGRTGYIVGWTSLSITGGMAVLAGIFGGMAMKAKRTVENADQDAVWQGNLDRHAKNYDRYRIATGVCTGIAVAALTSSIISFIIARRAESREGRSGRPVSVTPAMSSSQVGLDFKVSF